MAMAKPLAFVLLLTTLLAASMATTLTLHNVCPYPVWPLITPNYGFPSISNNTFRLEPLRMASFPFTPYFWSGRVVARTGCNAAASRCETGRTPPFTIVQLSVHDLVVYSVSLVDGFNVPVVIRPQAGGSGQCPALGCAVNLNRDCPSSQRVLGAGGAVVACRGPASYFKDRCPYTRTTPSDTEPVPQSCFSPGELKIVFCPRARVGGEGEPELIRTVVADN